MQRPPNITWRDVDHDEQLDAKVLDYIAKLDKVHPRITGVDVMVERLHQSRRQGNQFHVRVDVHLPGDQIVVKRDPPQAQAREELQVALRDAFKATRRVLQETQRKVRGDVKAHDEMPVGTVAALSDESEGYGFIRTGEGREIYFHAHAVQNLPWDELSVGQAVRFVEESGEQGPQASAVYVA